MNSTFEKPLWLHERDWLCTVELSYVDGVVAPPKTASSRRPLPLPPQAIEALIKWKAKSAYTQA